MNRRSKPAIILGSLFGLIMLIGLPWYIFSVLNKHSRRSGQSDAIAYLLNGKPVLATVIKEFKANSVGSHGGTATVSGSSTSFACAIDLETGKQLWNIKLDAENDKGQDWGDAILLAQSDKYLFFLRNELYIVSKEDGKVVARNKDLKDIQDKLMKETTIYPTIVTNYAYEDTTHAIIIKGSDGLAYQLDINTLKSKPDPRINVANYFFRKQMEFRKTIIEDYWEQLVTFTRDNNLQFAFINDNDYQILQKEGKLPYGTEPRRALYAAAVSSPLTAMKKTSNEVYLFGGFLKAVPQDSVLYSRDYKDPYICRYHFVPRGDLDLQTPMHLPNGGYIILHRASVAQDAPILLTAVTPDGKKLWHIATGFSGINKVLMIKDQLLILAGTAANNSGEVSDILSISLADGKVRTYNFKAGQFN